MGSLLLVVFVVSVGVTLALSAYGLRVLVGRWDRPTPYVPPPAAPSRHTAVQAPAQAVQVVHATPVPPPVRDRVFEPTSAAPPPAPRMARGSIPPAIPSHGPRYTVVKSSRTKQP